MRDDIADEYEALLQFLYLAPVGLIQSALDGEIVMINPLSAQLLMPLSADGGLSNVFNALERVAPELRHMAANFSQPRGAICEGFRVQLTAGIPGKEHPSVLGVSLIKIDGQRLMAVISDITQTVAQERQLKHQTAWFNAILTGITDYALMTLDAEGRIENWNASIGRVTGYAESSIIGEPFSVFYPEGAITPERVADYLREADDNGWSLDDGWRTKADGSRFWGSSMIAPLDDAFLEQISSPIVRSGSERGYALIMRDITDKHVATEKQLSAMLSDHLTGIPNRRAFFEAADLEMKRWRRFPRPLSVLVIDADHFKKINDTFGHATGDVVLRDLAQTLKKSVREIDIIARVGGEEFAALLPSTDLEGAKILAERIRKEIEWKSLTVDGITIQYTVSIGISTMTDAVTGFDELLKLADQALYQAKGAGRNQIKMASGGAAH